MEESIEGRIEEDTRGWKFMSGVCIRVRGSYQVYYKINRCIPHSLGDQKKFKSEHAGVRFAVGGQWVKMGEGPHNPKLSAMRPNTHYGMLFFAKGGHHAKRLVGNLCCPTLDVSLSIIGAPQH